MFLDIDHNLLYKLRQKLSRISGLNITSVHLTYKKLIRGPILYSAYLVHLGFSRLLIYFYCLSKCTYKKIRLKKQTLT